MEGPQISFHSLLYYYYGYKKYKERPLDAEWSNINPTFGGEIALNCTLECMSVAQTV